MANFPRHPDKCGGLKPLGDYCFDTTLPIIVYMLVFVSIAVGGTILGEVEEEIIKLAYAGLFVLGIPILTASFFLPLMKIHNCMVHSRREEEDSYEARVSHLETEIYQTLDSGGELQIAKNAKQELEIIQLLNPNEAGYPTWPFRLRVIAKVYSPQILALVGVIISIVDLAINR